MAKEQATNENGLDPLESITHAFIVKVWREERNSRTGGALWRGHIIHVPGNERISLKRLNEIGEFIKPYLKAMGVHFGLMAIFKRWLKG